MPARPATMGSVCLQACAGVCHALRARCRSRHLARPLAHYAHDVVDGRARDVGHVDRRRSSPWARAPELSGRLHGWPCTRRPLVRRGAGCLGRPPARRALPDPPWCTRPRPLRGEHEADATRPRWGKRARGTHRCTRRARGRTVRTCDCTARTPGCTDRARGCTHRARGCTHRARGCTHRAHGCTHRARCCTHRTRGCTTRTCGGTACTRGCTARTCGGTACTRGCTARTRSWTARTRSWTARTRDWTARSRGWTTRTRGLTARTRGWTARTRGWTARTRGWTARTRGWTARTRGAIAPSRRPLHRLIKVLSHAPTSVIGIMLSVLVSSGRLNVNIGHSLFGGNTFFWTTFPVRRS
jgi:Herpes virus major outer envelope glycoprotein (BLLF1)